MTNQIERDACPSCGGLNTSCPDGCGRDPVTGELNGTRLTNEAAPAGEVEAARRDMAAAVEGDSDNPLRVAEANAILRGARDAEYGLAPQTTPDVGALVEALRDLADAARSACDAQRHQSLIEALVEADTLIALAALNPVTNEGEGE